MPLPDHDDFDPDDNFAASESGESQELDDDADLDALAWQWLLLVNPGDEDAAQQQFRDWQDARPGDEDIDTGVAALLDATDWRASFRVHEDDPVTLIDALNTLAGRFRVEIDWNLEDPTDPAQLAGMSPGALIGVADDQLRIDGYTIWTWDPGDATVAGVIALRDDDEGMRLVGHALGLDLRAASG